jgi:ribonuclease Z
MLKTIFPETADNRSRFAGTAAVLATGLVFLITSCASLPEEVLYRGVVRQLEQNAPDPYVDGAMEIIVTGSGGPMPNPDRGNPSITVKVNGKVYLFDAGAGTENALREFGIPMGDLDSIFLTHFHSDHVAGMGEVKLYTWISGRQYPLNVYGPTGLDYLVEGLARFYSLDDGYRIAHHPEEVVRYSAAPFASHEFRTPGEGELAQIYEEGDFRVLAFVVNHDPVAPAVGYRLEYKDRVAVITGDSIYTENLVDACIGADVIFADGLDHELTMILERAAEETGDVALMHIAQDIREYQMDPSEAARLAQEAGRRGRGI